MLYINKTKYIEYVHSVVFCCPFIFTDQICHYQLWHCVPCHPIRYAFYWSKNEKRNARHLISLINRIHIHRRGVVCLNGCGAGPSNRASEQKWILNKAGGDASVCLSDRAWGVSSWDYRNDLCKHRMAYLFNELWRGPCHLNH